MILNDRVLFQICRILDKIFRGYTRTISATFWGDSDRNYAEFLERNPDIKAIYKAGKIKWKFNSSGNKVLFYISGEDFDVVINRKSYPNQRVSDDDISLAYLYFKQSPHGGEKILDMLIDDLRNGVFSNVEDAINRYFSSDVQMDTYWDMARKEFKEYVGKPYSIGTSIGVRDFVSKGFKLDRVVPIFCIDFSKETYGYASSSGRYVSVGGYSSYSDLFVSLGRCVRSNLSVDIYYLYYNNREY